MLFFYFLQVRSKALIRTGLDIVNKKIDPPRRLRPLERAHTFDNPSKLPQSDQNCGQILFCSNLDFIHIFLLPLELAVLTDLPLCLTVHGNPRFAIPS